MMLDTNGPRPLLKKTTQDLGEFLVVAAERCTSSLNISPSSFRFLSWLTFTSINISPPPAGRLTSRDQNYYAAHTHIFSPLCIF